MREAGKGLLPLRGLPSAQEKKAVGVQQGVTTWGLWGPRFFLLPVITWPLHDPQEAMEKKERWDSKGGEFARGFLGMNLC